MDYQSLHIKTVVELRQLARQLGVRVPAGTNKAVLIDMLLEADSAPAAKPEKPAKAPEPAAQAGEKSPAAADKGGKPTDKADKAGRPAGQSTAVENAPRRRGRPPKARPAADGADAASAKARPAPVKKPAAAPEAAPQAKPQTASSPKEKAPLEDAERPGRPATPASAAAPVRTAEPTKASAQGDKAGERAPEPVENAATRPVPTPETGAEKAETGVPQRQGYTGHGFIRQRPAAPQGGQRGMTNGYVNRNIATSGSAEGRQQSSDAQRPQGARFVARSEGAAREYPQIRRPQEPAAQAPRQAEQPYESGSARGRREGYYNAEYKTSNPAVPEMLAAGECNDGAGVLEIQPDGYGFLRAENCLPGPNDVYISIAQIRRFNLRMGDYVVGKTRPQREGDRYSAMLYITSVNGATPEAASSRPRFEDLIPIYPDQRLRLEAPNPVGRGDLSLRLVDMLAPIGKGQRGMIVSQPKAGKTTLLKKVANAITANYPEVELIVLLIDERPEEVTDMKRSIQGEVIYSTFDEEPEHHVRVSEMVLERAQRLTEMGKDVVVLMDSITRLARAYNLVITPTGRSLSGGLDPGALFKPKRFFGAARNIENGGSLTIIATALVETGSRMDDIIFEEFKGTGNMELHLDRKLSDKRVFPAIDMVRSGTRREELLLTEAELDGEMLVRRVLSGGRGQEMAEQVIDLMSKTANNAEFFSRLRGWLGVFEKEGFTLGGK